LKAIGYLIPLMDAEYANYYTREVMLILIREFQSPDEEMKKIVLKVFLFSFSIYLFQQYLKIFKIILGCQTMLRN
jgi:flagellar biosynthesis regulator FlaF